MFQRILLICLVAGMLQSCFMGVDGRGPVSLKSQEVSAFSGIRCSGNFKVEYSPSAQHSLSVVTNENLHQYFVTEVKDAVLYLQTTRNIKSADSLLVRIASPQLHKLESSGAVRFRSKGIIMSPGFRLQSSGASKIEIELKAHRTWIESSGASVINIEGSAEEGKIVATGASKLSMGQFEFTELDLSCSGASKGELWVRKSLRAHLSGSSMVQYYGDPPLKQLDVSGAAEIKSLDQ